MTLGVKKLVLTNAGRKGYSHEKDRTSVSYCDGLCGKGTAEEARKRNEGAIRTVPAAELG